MGQRRLARVAWAAAAPQTSRVTAATDCTIDLYTTACTGPLVVWSYTSAQRQALMRFDIDQALPENARVLSATLHLRPAYASTAYLSNPEVTVWPLLDPWNTAVTWNTPDGTNPWSQPRGTFGGASLGPVNPTQLRPAGSEFTADVTEAVRFWSSGVLQPDGLVMSSHRRPQYPQGSADYFAPSEDVARTPYIEIVHDQQNDDFRPEVTTSGALVDQEAGYVGAGSYTLTVAADDNPVDSEPGDTVSGIRRIELRRPDGTVYAVQHATCAPACPITLTATFAINTTAMPEGILDLDVVAVDDAGLAAMERALFTVVDRTAPPAPDRVRLRGFDPSAGSVQLNWREGLDPAIGEVASSQIARTEYRVSRNGGAFGAWVGVADDPHGAISPVAEGDRLDVQLRSVDSVGNTSGVTVAQLVVQREPASAAPASSSVAMVMEETDSPCPPRLDSWWSRRAAPDYHDFVETRIWIRMSVVVSCAAYVDPRIIQSIEITARLAMETGESGDTSSVREVGEPVTRSATAPDWLGERRFQSFPYLCETGMAGWRNYHLTGTIKLRLDNLPDRTDHFITPEFGRLRCPTLAQRLGWQEQGWRFLKQYSSEYRTNSDKRGKRRPSEWLGDDLGEPPWTPPGVAPRAGWQAHHTVPHGGGAIGRDSTRGLHGLLFRACIHPNERGNGVYLRARALRRKNNDGTPNPNYVALEDHDRATGQRLAQRTYHGDTFRATYVNQLYARLPHGAAHLYKCNETGRASRPDVLTDLASIGGDLVAGRMNLGRPRR